MSNRAYPSAIDGSGRRGREQARHGDHVRMEQYIPSVFARFLAAGSNCFSLLV